MKAYEHSRRIAVLVGAVLAMIAGCNSDDSQAAGAGDGGSSATATGTTAGRGDAANAGNSSSGSSGKDASAPAATATGSPTSTATASPTSTAQPPTTSASVYGDVHNGQYDLGPVEWTGSFNNSCSPYTSAIEGAEGKYLVGLDSKYNGDGHLCDACVIVNTAKGKTIVLRVVTTGAASGPENMDISQEAFSLINQSEYPRTMTWQLAKCPDSGKIFYQFQTGANVDWTSLWVRNARVPITKVEVKSAKHASFVEIKRGSDGTLTDGGGFGTGSFSIRLTGMDGQTITDTFPSFKPGDVLSGSQFQ